VNCWMIGAWFPPGPVEALEVGPEEGDPVGLVIGPLEDVPVVVKWAWEDVDVELDAEDDEEAQPDRTTMSRSATAMGTRMRTRLP